MSHPLAPATRPPTPIERMRGLLSSPNIKSKIDEVLGQRAPQFASSIIQLVSGSRQLQECDPNSIVGSAMIAAVLDLPIEKNLGFAHIVPYGGVAQFQMGAKGFIQLAIRSGQYKHLNATEVYDGEFVSYNRLTGELKLDFAAKKNDTVVGYAAYFQLVSGYEQAVYWTVAEVTEHAKKFSQAYKSGKKDSPWFTNFDAMGRKTAIKDLISHWGIMSVQMQRALVEDQAVHRGIDTEPEYVDNLKSAAPSKPEHALPTDDGDLGPKDAKPKPESKPEAKPEPPSGGAEQGKAEPPPSNVIPLKQPEPAATTPPPAPAAPEPPDATKQVINDAEVAELVEKIREKMKRDGVTDESKVMKYCAKNKLCPSRAASLAEMAPNKLAILLENWERIACEKIKAM